MSSTPPEIIVTPGASLPEVVVEVSDLIPQVRVVSSEVGLAGPIGPAGPAGPAGPQGQDGLSTADSITGHIYDELPHPVYDDGASFLLIYENAKV